MLIFFPRLRCSRGAGVWCPGLEARICARPPPARLTTLLRWRCPFTTWHEDALIGLTDARSAEGAKTRAKRRAAAIDQRVFMDGNLEYTQQQINSAIKSCTRVTFVGPDCIFVGKNQAFRRCLGADRARVAQVSTFKSWKNWIPRDPDRPTPSASSSNFRVGHDPTATGINCGSCSRMFLYEWLFSLSQPSWEARCRALARLRNPSTSPFERPS